MNRSSTRGDSAVPSAKRRILEVLKASSPASAAELAGVVGITDTAVRQHLTELEARGLVEPVPAGRPAGTDSSTSSGSRRRRGRPAALWRTTDLAGGLFPDGHADLAVSFLEAAHDSLGDVGLERLLRTRADRQAAAYASSMPARASLARRLEILARTRSDEGYMAEVRAEADGTYLFIEHHCPICAAATICQGLCRTELDVFRSVLGAARVEREEHLLAGESRCVYRVTPREAKRTKPQRLRRRKLR